METRRTLMRSLAVAVVIASVIWTTTAEDQKPDTSCCTDVSRAKLTDPILNFRLQRESLPCVKAVIFETERGDFCSDPRQPWVKEKVKQFFRAQRNKPLTSPAPPTSSISDQTHVGGATQDKASPEMLVQVECKGNPKWIRIPEKNDCFDFCGFIKASAKFNLPHGANVVLKDSAGVDVDADIFDELVRTSKVSFKILDGDNNKSDNVPQAEIDLSEPSCPGSSFSSIESESSESTVIPQSSKASKKRFLEEPSDCNASKDLVHAALHSKPGGSDILKEYEQTSSLSDKTRKKLVNILVADMVEKYGRIPPVSIRLSYALGIITLFPNLKDKCSPTGYEHYYDPRSGQGYIAYRLKTVQRNSVNNLKGASKVVYQDGPKTLRKTSSATEQLSGDECTEAISMMKHSTDTPVIKDKMRTTFKYRQNLIHDPDKSSLILDYFPRFLDTPGLIDQDFTMLFGDDISSKFIAKWPTFYKQRVIADCKNLHPGAHVDG